MKPETRQGLRKRREELRAVAESELPAAPLAVGILERIEEPDEGGEGTEA